MTKRDRVRCALFGRTFPSPATHRSSSARARMLFDRKHRRLGFQIEVPRKGAPSSPRTGRNSAAERWPGSSPTKRGGAESRPRRCPWRHSEPAATAIDAQRTVGIPRRGDLSAFRAEIGRAREKSPALESSTSRLAIHHHVERSRQMPSDGKVAGNARGHEILDQRGDGERLWRRVCSAARNSSCQSPLAEAKLAWPTMNAARVMVFEIDGEVGHLPSRLRIA